MQGSREMPEWALGWGARVPTAACQCRRHCEFNCSAEKWLVHLGLSCPNASHCREAVVQKGDILKEKLFDCPVSIQWCHMSHENKLLQTGKKFSSFSQVFPCFCVHISENAFYSPLLCSFWIFMNRFLQPHFLINNYLFNVQVPGCVVLPMPSPTLDPHYFFLP